MDSGDDSVGSDGSAPSVLEWVSAGVAVVGGLVDEVAVALARSLPVVAGEVTVLGRVGGPADWAVVAEALSTVVPSVGLVRLAMSGAGVEDRSGLVAAAVVAERLGVEVVAPAGCVVVVPGGTLFADAGWRRFGVGAAADGGGPDEAMGRRFPTPGWQAGLDTVADEGPSAGLVRAVIPAGVWLYPDLPDQATPGCDDLAFAIPVDVDRPMLLVGRPGVPAPDPDAVVAVADRLPRTVRGNLVIVPYGPGSAVCSQVSERLSRRWARTVAMATGLPVPTTSTQNRSRNVDHDSAPMGGPRLGRASSPADTAPFPDHPIASDRAAPAEPSIRSRSQISAYSSSGPVRRGGRLLLGAALAVATVAASGGIVFALRAEVDAGSDADWAAVSAPAAVASPEPAPAAESPTSIAATPTAQRTPSQSPAARDPSRAPRPTEPAPPATKPPTAVPDMPGEPNPTGRNLALSGTVTASSTEEAPWIAQNAIDGDRTTRWSSDWGSDPQWIAVDLGSIWSLTEVRLVWEAAYATSYRVEISRDGATWSALRNVTGGTGGTVRVDASSALARHVRVVGIQRATGYGYSLWEIEVR